MLAALLGGCWWWLASWHCEYLYGDGVAADFVLGGVGHGPKCGVIGAVRDFGVGAGGVGFG